MFAANECHCYQCKPRLFPLANARYIVSPPLVPPPQTMCRVVIDTRADEKVAAGRAEEHNTTVKTKSRFTNGFFSCGRVHIHLMQDHFEVLKTPASYVYLVALIKLIDCAGEECSNVLLWVLRPVAIAA